MDKLTTFCNSWTIKLFAGFSMAFLAKVLTDSNIAALLLGLAAFWGLMGIFHNNVIGWKRWVSVGILIIGFIGGGLILWIKYQPKITPGTQISFRLTSGNSKFFVRTDVVILKGAKMYLGIVPFGETKLIDSNQSWISSKKVTGDPLLYNFDFSTDQINFSTQQVTMAFLIVQWHGFPNGFMPLIFYSWNYTEGKDWAHWRRDLPDKIFNPKQSDEVQRFVHKINACMISHSKDRQYNVCFDGFPE